ncbi:MAG: FHA domain-containing protein, partial [Candidatus Binatia bacterium]
MIVRIEGGEQPARAVELGRAEAVLGKHSACDVVLPDARVSRRHAKLVEDGGGLWLEDLGSANGTTVGGKPVTTRVALGKADEIAIGPFRIRAESSVLHEEKTQAGARGEPSAAVPPPGPLAALLADERVTEI